MINQKLSVGEIYSGSEKFWLCAIGSAVIIYSGYQLIAEEQINRYWTIQVTVLCGFLIGFYLLAIYIHFKNLLLFGAAYLLAFCVFHLGHIIGDATGWLNITYFRSGAMAYWCQQAGWQITLALGSYIVGASLGFRSVILRPAISDNGEVDQYAESTSTLFWNGIGLLLASILAMMFLVAAVGNIFVYSRAQLYAGVGDTRGLNFTLLVLPTAILMLVCGAKSRNQKMVAYLSAAATCLAVFFLGERSAVFFPAFVGAALWVNLGKRIPRLVVIASAIILIMVIPVVSYLRAMGPYSKINTDDLVRSVETTNASDAIVELGGVVELVANVSKWVPKEMDYLYGWTYVHALAEAVPNIGTTISKSPREIIKHGSWSAEKLKEFLSPADWYIYRTNRYKFDHGGGSGFSAVAEAYLNFGVFGIAFVFLMIGYLLSRLDHVRLYESSMLLTLATVIIWPLMKTVRNDFGSFVKPVSLILWTLLIWGIGTYFLKRCR